MARPRQERRKGRPRILYLVPVISVLSLAVIYYVAFATPPSPPLVQNFSLEISIDLYTDYPNGTSSIQYGFPDRAVGIPGGYWVSHKYASDGVRGVSPIYSPNPASVYPNNVYPGYTTIFVKSMSNRTYYLGDYFAIWGEALGQNNTLGYTAPPQSSLYPPSWSWHMCVGPDANSLRPGLWGKEPLVSNMRIVLAYEESGPCGF